MVLVFKRSSLCYCKGIYLRKSLNTDLILAYFATCGGIAGVGVGKFGVGVF